MTSRCSILWHCCIVRWRWWWGKSRSSENHWRIHVNVVHTVCHGHIVCTDQNLCTVLCTLHHILIVAAKCLRIQWHHLQGAYKTVSQWSHLPNVQLSVTIQYLECYYTTTVQCNRQDTMYSYRTGHSADRTAIDICRTGNKLEGRQLVINSKLCYNFTGTF